MTEQVMELVRSMAGGKQDEELLRTLCVNACRVLDGALREGVASQDCGEAYRLAAAWIVLDWLRAGRDWSGVTALSAGDMTVRREEAGKAGELSRLAMELLAPWLRDSGFVFQGVKG